MQSVSSSAYKNPLAFMLPECIGMQTLNTYRYQLQIIFKGFLSFCIHTKEQQRQNGYDSAFHDFNNKDDVTKGIP
jgi:hypothetical protein